MKTIDPRWVVTGVVAGVTLGLSIGQTVYTFTRPPDPQPITVDVMLANGGGGSMGIGDINTADPVVGAHDSMCSGDQCVRIIIAHGPTQ